MASAAWHRELLVKYLHLSRGDGSLAISHRAGALCPLARKEGDIKMIIFIILFYYLLLAARGLHRCVQAFSSCSALASHCVASLVVEHGESPLQA